MNSRSGIWCLAASALIALAVAACSHSSSTTPTPTPSPSPSGTEAPDTLYVETQAGKEIRQYKGASQINGLTIANAEWPDSDISNGDVIYFPVSGTLWYATAYYGNPKNWIEIWPNAPSETNMNPTLVPFQYGEGAMCFDPTHNLLFVASQQGPQVSVYTDPEALTASSTPAAVITMNITDVGGATPRPQEMLYDPGTDRLFASDQVTEVSTFDGFGTAAEAAVTGHTNPTITPNRYITGLFAPDGLAYAPLPTDTLFVGEQQATSGFIDVIPNASTFSGSVSHGQEITGFIKPGGMAYDSTARNLLYVYDSPSIYVIPNAIAAAGKVSSIVGLHVITDASGTENEGFGLSLDQTH
jgi:hypothetical protein